MEACPGRASRASAGYQDQIDWRQPVLVLAERLARDPLNAIPVDRSMSHSLTDGQAQARPATLIGRSENGEVRVGDPLSAREHAAERAAVEQPRFPREGLAKCHVALDAQASSPLGATRLDHLTAFLGGHTGAEPVCALALDDARLISALHGDTRGSLRNGLAADQAGEVTPDDRCLSIAWLGNRGMNCSNDGPRVARPPVDHSRDGV